MTFRKPKVGEIFWRLNIGNAARNRDQKLEAVRVTHVGRKWFTVAPDDLPHRSDRFTITDREQDSGPYSPTAALYDCPLQWEDEKEAAELWRMMRSLFNYVGSPQLPLDVLREIRDVIDRSRAS